MKIKSKISRSEENKLIERTKERWREFVVCANELSTKGFYVSIENGWEVLDAPFDDEISDIVIEEMNIKKSI